MSYGEPLAPSDCGSPRLRPERFFRLDFEGGKVGATMFGGILHFDFHELAKAARIRRPDALLATLSSPEWKLWPTPWSKGRLASFACWSGAVTALSRSRCKGKAAAVAWLMRTGQAIYAAAEATAVDHLHQQLNELYRMTLETLEVRKRADDDVAEARAHARACGPRMEAYACAVQQDQPCHRN